MIITAASGSALSRTGYGFGSWNTAADGSGASYAASAAFTFTADTTLYAQWTGNTYTVKYDANGGTGTMADSSFTYGISKALAVGGFTKVNYAFAGWSASPSGSVVYADGQSVKNLSAENNAAVTLYAKWTAQPALSSSIGDGKICAGGRIVLNPNIDGGTWDWDATFFSATFNSPATFTALKQGTSTITYTVDGQSIPYTVAVGEALSLASPDTGSNIYTGGRVTLTPNISGGTWNYDSTFVKLTQNSDGTATFKALKPGTITVTYTAQGVSVSYTISIAGSSLPSTGQDFTLVWVLAALAVLAAMLAAAGVFCRHAPAKGE